MQKEQIVKLWVLVNKKESTMGIFKEKTGLGFDDYFKQNKKECLAEWNNQQVIDRLRIRREKKVKKGIPCVCSIHEKVKNQEVTWKCKIHGNCWNGIKNKDLLTDN